MTYNMSYNKLQLQNPPQNTKYLQKSILKTKVTHARRVYTGACKILPKTAGRCDRLLAFSSFTLFTKSHRRTSERQV